MRFQLSDKTVGQLTSMHALPTLRLVEAPRLVRRPAIWLLWTMLLALLALIFVPWVQTVEGEGNVIAFAPLEREQIIEAPLDGRVVTWWVREGEQVSKGARIADIADNDPELVARLRRQQEAAEQEVAAAEESILELERRIESITSTRELNLEAGSKRVDMARNSVRAAEQELEAYQAALKAAELNYKRRVKLADDGLVSTRKLELAEMKMRKARADVYAARAKLSKARSEVLAKRADRSGKGTDFDAKLAKARSELQKARADRAKANKALAETESKLSKQQQMIVTAPRDGVIVRLAASEGTEYVKSGDPLAIFVPNTNQRAVEMWVDGNDAPLITPGRNVRLQFEGWPAVQFSGWPSVAVGTFGAEVAFVEARANERGKFRVVVVPREEGDWPANAYLRQGARARGWLLLNEVSLGYEFWRQLNDFPPSVPNAPKMSDGSSIIAGKKGSEKKKGGK